MLGNPPDIKIFEPAPALKIALLDLHDFASFLATAAKREVERKAALYVVRWLTGNGRAEIRYEKSGKPYLEKGPQISVSHAFDKLAVALSSNGLSPGVDIEKVREKVLLIKEKFLSEAELEQLRGASAAAYTICWAAKESLYKACGLRGLLFARELLIEPFEERAEGTLRARVTRSGAEKTYTLQYKKLEDYVLVYTLKSEQ